LVVDRGLIVKKDVSVGGFVSSNQGALMLGSGLNNQMDPPKIVLSNSDLGIIDGGGYHEVPAIPHGSSGTSFPLVPITGTYYLRTDATPQYHNRVFKYIGAGWVDTTSTNTAAKQLFRVTNSFMGKAANSIFESYNDGQWNWEYVGPASDYTGKYFDTLHLTKQDHKTPAHLDVGNVTIHGYAAVHGYFGVGGTITTNLTPAASNLALGTPTERWKGVVTDTVYVKDLSPIVAPHGYGDHIKATASLNPASSGLALGSPTDRWLGVVTDTSYVKNLAPIAAPYSYGDSINITGTMKSTVNGVGYRSYHGGGGGGNNGGICLDKYGNVCFVGGSSSNYWSVTPSVDATPIFAVGYSGWVSVLSLGGTGTRSVYSMANGQLTNTSSSERYKENIQELKDSSWIYDLKPVSFDWKDTERKKTDGLQIGLIAENVHSLCPELAWTNEQGQPEGIHYEKLAVPMLAEMKKLRAELEELKAELAAYKKEKAA